MQILKEIIYLLRDNNVYPIDYLKSGDSKRTDSKLLKLYEGITSGKFNSDAEAEKAIYTGSIGSVAYRKLKSDLKDRLLDAVQQIDTRQPGFSDYQKAYYACHRQWLTVKILAGLNANNAAISLATKLLKVAEKFHLTLISIDITSYLRIQYGLRDENDTRFREVNAAFKKFNELHLAESKAEELYAEIISQYVNVRTVKPGLEQAAIDCYEQIAGEMALFKSYKLQMYGYLLGLLRYTSVNNFVKALEYCNEAVLFFESLPYEAPTPLQIFHYQSLLCNIQLRRFPEGKIAANECLRLMVEGSFNWFKYQELYLQLALHSREYAQADSVLEMIFNHERFEFLPDNVKELWIIYESYMYYLHLMEKVTMDRATKFNLNYFERKTTIFSRDKGGMNVAILIIRFLIQIKQGQKNKILDEQDSLNQYCYRHLRGENTQRSYKFIKMLLLIPGAQFAPKLVEQKSEVLREQLRELPVRIADQSNEIEIVPYEHLWEMVIESLKAKGSGS